MAYFSVAKSFKTLPTEETIRHTLDHLFRRESGKMIAVLSRLLGINHIDTAEDIVQDTLLQAMSTWPFGGMPNHPSAWLYRVAKNKAIDLLRRKKRFKIISTDDDHLMRTGADSSLNQDDLFLDE